MEKTLDPTSGLDNPGFDDLDLANLDEVSTRLQPPSPPPPPPPPRWKFCPKEQLVFLSQISIIFIVVITCVVNLSLRDDKIGVWTSLLGLSLGSILPEPKYKKTKDDLPSNQ